MVSPCGRAVPRGWAVVFDGSTIPEAVCTHRRRERSGFRAMTAQGGHQGDQERVEARCGASRETGERMGQKKKKGARRRRPGIESRKGSVSELSFDL
jgi:hypothetical protein